MTTQDILSGCQRQVQVELLEKLVINHIPFVLQEDKLKNPFCQPQNITPFSIDKIHIFHRL